MTRTARILSGGALAWALGVTVARTVRPPNDFAEAHWLLDYRFGFIRRGLAGSVLRELSVFGTTLQTESAIATVSYGVFAALCLALLAVMLRIAARTRWCPHTLLVLAAFATSPFVITNAHLMGYLDHVVYLLALGAVWATLRGRMWVGAALAAISVLVHETTLVVALPLLAMATWARARSRSDGAPSTRTWPPLLLTVAAFAAVAVAESMTDRQTLRTLLQLRLHRYPFVAGDMHLFVPEWLTTSLGENVAAQRGHFLERLTDGAIVVSVLPAVQALLFGAFAWMAPARRRVLGVAAVLVTCAPLVLHLSAWDTARLWTYTIGAALGALWIVVEALPGDGAAALTFAPLVVVPVLLANVVGRVPLLDGAVERFSSPRLLALYAPAIAAGAAGWFLTARDRGGRHA